MLANVPRVGHTLLMNIKFDERVGTVHAVRVNQYGDSRHVFECAGQRHAVSYRGQVDGLESFFLPAVSLVLFCRAMPVDGRRINAFSEVGAI